MKNRGRQHSVSATFCQHIIEILQLACTAAGDNRHIYGTAYGLRQSNVIAVFRAVGIHACQQDFSGTERYAFFCPFHGIKSRRLTPALHINLPLVLTAFTCINCENNALVTKQFGTVGNQLRIFYRCGIERGFISTGTQSIFDILHAADAAADCQRHKNLGRSSADNIQHRLALLKGRSNIKENKLISTLGIISRRTFHRVTGITQTDWLPVQLGRLALPASLCRVTTWEQLPDTVQYSEAAAAALALRACRAALLAEFPDAVIEAEQREISAQEGAETAAVTYIFTANIAAPP